MRREGEKGKGNIPPSRNRENVVEIWCYIPEVYTRTFGSETESIDKCSEKFWKMSIFHRDFDQKISKYALQFSNISSFKVQTRKFLDLSHFWIFDTFLD